MLTLNLTESEKAFFEKEKERWNFKDNESMVKFAMAVMSRSATKTLIVKECDEHYYREFGEHKQEEYKPNDGLLKLIFNL